MSFKRRDETLSVFPKSAKILYKLLNLFKIAQKDKIDRVALNYRSVLFVCIRLLTSYTSGEA